MNIQFESVPSEPEEVIDHAMAVVRAMDIRSLTSDTKWQRSLLPVLEGLRARAAQRAEHTPLSLDGLIQAAYWKGQRDAIPRILRFLERVRQAADASIEETKQDRPA